MEAEINRRINILNNKKVPVITQRDLRGGMQKRVHRQEIKRYGDEINSKRARLQKQLISLHENEQEQDLSLSAFITAFELEDFNEPVFRKIRSKGGFF